MEQAVRFWVVGQDQALNREMRELRSQRGKAEQMMGV
jgi:hypothetical protein